MAVMQNNSSYYHNKYKICLLVNNKDSVKNIINMSHDITQQVLNDNINKIYMI